MKNCHEIGQAVSCSSLRGCLGKSAALALLVGLTVLPGFVIAQTSPPAAGSTANTSDAPPASTPIPRYFQQSYQAYLKMKADAHGGSNYTRERVFGDTTCPTGQDSGHETRLAA